MDFLTDKSGRHLLRINNTVTVPDYVKQADIGESLVADLPATAFADPVTNQFPINTPAHVFLSYGYCKSANVTNPRLLKRIKKAAALLNITPDLDMLDQAFVSVKSASTVEDRKFAISIDFGDGQEKTASLKGVQNFYPINDVHEVESSAAELDNHKRRLPLDLYVQGAREIVKTAAALNMPTDRLPDRIRLYGTEYLPNFEHIEQEAQRRERITGDDSYTAIAKSAAVNEEGKCMDDYVKLWTLADAWNGVQPSQTILDPYRIFNTGMSKAAYDQALKQHVLLAGTIVPIAAIAQVDTDTVKRHFPKEAATAVMALVKSATEAATDEVTVLVGDLTKTVQNALLRLIAAP